MQRKCAVPTSDSAEYPIPAEVAWWHLSVMGRRQKVKSAAKNRKLKRRERDLKRRSRDIDQVHEDLIKGRPQVLDEDLPGKGQYYCTACARYFINEQSLKVHVTTKTHKRRSTVALEAPWTQAAAELASR